MKFTKKVFPDQSDLFNPVLTEWDAREIITVEDKEVIKRELPEYIKLHYKPEPVKA